MGESAYALKRKGIYPKNSPYVTGNWGKRMRKLDGYPVLSDGGAPSRFLTLEEVRAEYPCPAADVWREAIGHG